MRRRSELIWEVGMGLVALAGAITLFINLSPSAPSVAIGILFLVAFLFMLVSWVWKLSEAMNPVTVVECQIAINTMDPKRPQMGIEMGFISHDEVSLSEHMQLEVDEASLAELKDLVGFKPYFMLRTSDNTGCIKLHAGNYVSVKGTIPLDMTANYSPSKLLKVALSEKVKIGWKIMGRNKMHWSKAAASVVVEAGIM
jgi:hypothetical protein